MKTVVFTISVPAWRECFRKGRGSCGCSYYCSQEMETVCPFYNPDKVFRPDHCCTPKEQEAYNKVAVKAINEYWQGQDRTVEVI